MMMMIGPLLLAKNAHNKPKIRLVPVILMQPNRVTNQV